VQYHSGVFYLILLHTSGPLVLCFEIQAVIFQTFPHEFEIKPVQLLWDYVSGSRSTDCLYTFLHYMFVILMMMVQLMCEH
jgi:hypothetical protein